MLAQGHMFRHSASGHSLERELRLIIHVCSRARVYGTLQKPPCIAQTLGTFRSLSPLNFDTRKSYSLLHKFATASYNI